jgi:predicted secreted protein
MATLLGKDGFVDVGGTAVGELRGFSVEHTAETIDDTVMGETSRGYKVTYKGFTATVDVLYDPANSGQDAFAVGSTVTLNLYPESQGTYGTPDSGDEKITGSAIVTGKSITSSYDGIIEASVSLQGSGDLTFTTVT